MTTNLETQRDFLRYLYVNPDLLSNILFDFDTKTNVKQIVDRYLLLAGYEPGKYHVRPELTINEKSGASFYLQVFENTLNDYKTPVQYQVIHVSFHLTPIKSMKNSMSYMHIKGGPKYNYERKEYETLPFQNIRISIDFNGQTIHLTLGDSPYRPLTKKMHDIGFIVLQALEAYFQGRIHTYTQRPVPEMTYILEKMQESLQMSGGGTRRIRSSTRRMKRSHSC